MPLYRPFPRSPPPLSLAPALSVFFPAGGCPFLSLSPSDSEPIAARGISPPPYPPFPSPFFLYPTIRLSSLAFSFLLAPSLPPLASPFPSSLSLRFCLLRPQLFHLFLGQMPRLGATSPLLSLFLPFLSPFRTVFSLPSLSVPSSFPLSFIRSLFLRLCLRRRAIVR